MYIINKYTVYRWYTNLKRLRTAVLCKAYTGEKSCTELRTSATPAP